MSFRLISEVPSFDFFKPLKFWLAVSILGVLLTIVVLPIRGLNYGVDFLGGTLILAEFPEHRDVGEYRAALSALDVGEPTVTEASGGSGGQVILMRVGNPEDAGEGAAPVADQVRAALDAQFPGVKYLQVDQVGGKVSDELVMTGIIAVGAVAPRDHVLRLAPVRVAVRGRRGGVAVPRRGGRRRHLLAASSSSST